MKLNYFNMIQYITKLIHIIRTGITIFETRTGTTTFTNKDGYNHFWNNKDGYADFIDNKDGYADFQNRDATLTPLLTRLCIMYGVGGII